MTDHQTAQRLLAMEDVLILTHRRPDGDTIGCAVSYTHLTLPTIRLV